MSTASELSVLAHDQICIEVDEPQTDYVKVRYHVLPGCRPSESGHVIGYWKNKNDMDFNIQPTGVYQVTSDAGTQTLELSLGAGSHVFAYATGKFDKNDYDKFKSSFCATGYVAPYDIAKSSAVKAVHLELKEVDLESVSVNVTVLETYKPGTANNWVGIWEGDFSYGSAPVSFAKVKHDKSVGTTIINIELKRNQAYVIAYGMGGFQESGINADARKTVAATLKFKR